MYPILWGYLRVSHAKSRSVREPYKLLIFAKVAKMLNEDFWDVIGRCLEDFVKEGKDFELTIMGGGPADVVEALRTIINKCLSLEILEKTIFQIQCIE